MSEFVLRTRNLCKSYSGKLAVDNVNMEIKRGQIYGFIGKNGAGKTTLMRMVCNLASSTKGEIELFGNSDPLYLAKARHKIGSMIENPALFPNMTAFENIETQRRLIGATGKGLIEDTLKLVGLSDTGKKKVKAFSLGMKQRVGLAVALLNSPNFLVLDEPINGMDPTGIAEIRETLKRLVSERNVTILISSHILSELNLLATNYGIINKGKLIKQISAEALKNECKQYIELVADNIPKTVSVLEEKLGIKDYKLAPNETIRVYEFDDNPSIINETMMKENISLKGISIKRQELEEYFISLIGGI